MDPDTGFGQTIPDHTNRVIWPRWDRQTLFTPYSRIEHLLVITPFDQLNTVFEIPKPLRYKLGFARGNGETRDQMWCCGFDGDNILISYFFWEFDC